MASELIEALGELARERNVDELILIDRLEQELAKSYQTILRLDWDARVIIDRETGKIYVYEMIGQGEEDPETGDYESYEEHDVTPDDVSRIAAQNAKRVINEIVRDAARANSVPPRRIRLYRLVEIEDDRSGVCDDDVAWRIIAHLDAIGDVALAAVRIVVRGKEARCGIFRPACFRCRIDYPQIPLDGA